MERLGLIYGIMNLACGLLYFIFPVNTTGDGTVNSWLAVVPLLVCTAVAIVKTLLFARQL